MRHATNLELWLCDLADLLGCAVLVGIAWLVLTPEGRELVKGLVRP